MNENPRLTQVSAAAGQGRRALLEAIRDRLAQELDGLAGHRRSCECRCGVPPDARTVPTLAAQLREIVKELDSLPQLQESRRDQIAEQRAKRRAEALGSAGASASPGA